jgi:hypothetical protein
MTFLLSLLSIKIIDSFQRKNQNEARLSGSNFMIFLSEKAVFNKIKKIKHC